MSTTTTLQSANQDIPLQVLRQNVDSSQHENDDARGDDERHLPTSQTLQTLSDSDSEGQEDTTQGATLSDSPSDTAKVENLQIRLSAMQVLLALVSLIGFFRDAIPPDHQPEAGSMDSRKGLP